MFCASDVSCGMQSCSRAADSLKACKMLADNLQLCSQITLKHLKLLTGRVDALGGGDQQSGQGTSSALPVASVLTGQDSPQLASIRGRVLSALSPFSNAINGRSSVEIEMPCCLLGKPYVAVCAARELMCQKVVE